MIDNLMEHQTGHPFYGIALGDIVRVFYHGAQVSLMIVTKIRDFSLHGVDQNHVKITIVGDELRFYADISPNRQSVLRDVKIQKDG